MMRSLVASRVRSLSPGGRFVADERHAGNFSIGSLVKLSFMSLSSEEDAKAVETFFAQHDTSAYSQPLSQGLDAVRSKAAWLGRDAEGASLFRFALGFGWWLMGPRRCTWMAQGQPLPLRGFAVNYVDVREVRRGREVGEPRVARLGETVWAGFLSLKSVPHSAPRRTAESRKLPRREEVDAPERVEAPWATTESCLRELEWPPRLSHSSTSPAPTLASH